MGSSSPCPLNARQHSLWCFPLGNRTFLWNPAWPSFLVYQAWWCKRWSKLDFSPCTFCQYKKSSVGPWEMGEEGLAPPSQQKARATQGRAGGGENNLSSTAVWRRSLLGKRPSRPPGPRTPAHWPADKRGEKEPRGARTSQGNDCSTKTGD